MFNFSWRISDDLVVNSSFIGCKAKDRVVKYKN